MNEQTHKEIYEPSQKELLWRQYNLHIELYKYYFDLAIKANTLFFTVTGAMLAFYFANSSIALIKFSLLLPAVMSITLGIAFIYGGILMVIVRHDIFELRDKLNLQTAPDVQILISLLRIFGVLFFIVAIGLIIFVYA